MYMGIKKVGIIGLGLIGGSIAKALRYRLGVKNIVAVDSCQDSIDRAVQDGVLLCGSTVPEDNMTDCDIIFLCTPVKKTLPYIQQLSSRVKPGCIITDVGSTKAEILNFVNSMANPPCFIGGHPMAGSEKTGYSAGSPHMFENAYYILCPSTSCTAESITVLTELVSHIGAIPVVLDAAEHDRVTGSISHLPHIVASALVNLVRETDSPDAKMKILAAGGFKDITRIASSSPEMWENIVCSNKQQLISILGTFLHRLEDFKAQLEGDDSPGIFEFFQQSKVYRDSFSGSKKGLIPSIYELAVDVVDKPGIIGEIATLLGRHGINIKNMTISNSREFEQGCLRIAFSDPESMEVSLYILMEAGYTVSRCC